jgi:hypothetical protein
LALAHPEPRDGSDDGVKGFQGLGGPFFLAHCGNFRPGNPAKKTEKLFSIQMQSTTCIFFFINILCDIGCSADFFSTKEGLTSAPSGKFLPATLLWTIDYRLWMVNLSVPGMPPGLHHALWQKPCGKDWNV